MSKWLNYWRKTIGRLKPAVEEQSLSSPPPPTTFLYPALRKTFAQALPHGLAVDPLESSLFYRSLEGKIVKRSLASGEIEWQSVESGYPLRVTDQILWAVENYAIAACSITNGQLLMRSNQLWLPGEVTCSVCDLFQQTLRIDLLEVKQWMGGIPHWSHQNAAGYEISLITGEVTEIYHIEDAIHDFKLPYNWQESNEQVYPSVSGEQLLKMNYPRGISQSAQLQSASLIIHNYRTADATQKVVLSVFSNQPPYSKLWEVIIQEFPPEPLILPYC